MVFLRVSPIRPLEPSAAKKSSAGHELNRFCEVIKQKVGRTSTSRFTGASVQCCLCVVFIDSPLSATPEWLPLCCQTRTDKNKSHINQSGDRDAKAAELQCGVSCSDFLSGHNCCQRKRQQPHATTQNSRLARWTVAGRWLVPGWCHWL